MARKRDSSPRYLRVQMILSDQDIDLKTWCAANRDDVGKVIRFALRDYLQRHHGEIPDEKIETSKAKAIPKWARARGIEPSITPSPSPGHPESTSPDSSTVSSPTSDEAVAPASDALSEDEKNRIKHFIDQNSDFT